MPVTITVVRARDPTLADLRKGGKSMTSFLGKQRECLTCGRVTHYIIETGVLPVVVEVRRRPGGNFAGREPTIRQS